VHPRDESKEKKLQGKNKTRPHYRGISTYLPNFLTYEAICVSIVDAMKWVCFPFKYDIVSVVLRRRRSHLFLLKSDKKKEQKK
jgi:hypothetical protein